MNLSIVMCGSNLSYAGNFLERMQWCLNSIFTEAKKHNLDAEFILVESGTPKENKPLTEAIDWSLATIPVRAIMVEKDFILKNIPDPYGIGFFETWMKNIGIRRSKGDFVLAINADSKYSSELVEFLSQKKLDRNCFYRVDRHDWSWRGRRKMLEGTIEVWEPAPPQGFCCLKVLANGCFIEGEPFEGVSKTGAPYMENMLHFNASGEFILMSRDKWFEIRGQPELEYWSSTDGQTVWLAVTHGLKQVVLPWPLKHWDHPRKASAYSPDWQDAKPFAIKNGENWGFKGVEFPEVIIN